MSSSGYVAVTDFDWFSFLQGRQPLEEVIEEHIESHWDETP